MELHFFAQLKVAESQISVFSLEAGNSKVLDPNLLRLRLFRHLLDDFYSRNFTEMDAGFILDAYVFEKNSTLPLCF
jgi:hypothetical protein